MSTLHAFALLASAFACPSLACAAVTFPNDFELPSNALGPTHAYFGGVTSWGASPSSTTIFSGSSLEVWANLVNDQFSVAGFAVGTFGISPPSLDVPDNADTFSITVRGPAVGALSLNITIREDDNNDGLIDVNGDDDAWESGIFMILPGTSVYNIPISAFQDLDPDSGNNLPNFTTTSRLAYFLTFESRDSYPGGQIIGPVSVLVDHVGCFVGPQVIPPSQVPGDANADSLVNIDDLILVILNWNASGSPGWIGSDLIPDGLINIDDLQEVVLHWQ